MSSAKIHQAHSAGLFHIRVGPTKSGQWGGRTGHTRRLRDLRDLRGGSFSWTRSRSPKHGTNDIVPFGASVPIWAVRDQIVGGKSLSGAITA
jgi:hypothetical protein